MPARPSAAPGRIPARLFGVGRLPQHEIHRLFLVRRHFHPRAGDHLVERAARQLAVIRLGGDIEQHMTFRRIGVPVAIRLWIIATISATCSVARGVMVGGRQFSAATSSL
jgi:hypothetical protein